MAVKSFRSTAKLAFSLRCSASNVLKISRNFRRNSTALCKMVILQPCKILPSTWSDWLPMVVTPSFQLRIMHRLKHWIVDFLRFEKTYSMHKSAPKVADMTVIKNASWQISLCFLSLHSEFPYGKGLQSFGSSCF